MAKATSVFIRQKRSSFGYSWILYTMTFLSCNFISYFECMNAICVLHFQQNKLFMHSARSGDSIARFKDRIETVYLDPCGEFLTQVLIHYIGHYLGQIHYWVRTEVNTHQPRPRFPAAVKFEKETRFRSIADVPGTLPYELNVCFSFQFGFLLSYQNCSPRNGNLQYLKQV